MTTLTETPAQQQKRARFDPVTTVIPIEYSSPLPPTKASRNIVISAVASLREPIQTFTLAISKTLNSIKARHCQQSQIHKKMQAPDYFPRSTRIDFTLNASQEVKESDPFLQLTAAATALSEDRQK